MVQVSEVVGKRGRNYKLCKTQTQRAQVLSLQSIPMNDLSVTRGLATEAAQPPEVFRPDDLKLPHQGGGKQALNAGCCPEYSMFRSPCLTPACSTQGHM